MYGVVIGLGDMCVVSGLVSSPADRLQAARCCCAQMCHPPSGCGWCVQCFGSRLVRFWGWATYIFVQGWSFGPVDLEFSEVLEGA